MTRLYDNLMGRDSKRFGMVVVDGEPFMQGGQLVVSCRCDCGTIWTPKVRGLIHGATTTCGCWRRQPGRNLPPTRTTHGQAGHGRGAMTKEYRAWRGMIGRCTQPSMRSYPSYGGRGIVVCDRWAASFETFLQDVGPAPSIQHYLGRADINLGYEPSNVRWVPSREMAKSTTRTRYLDWRGRRQSLAAWARETGIGATTISSRIRSGWTVENALVTPLPPGRSRHL